MDTKSILLAVADPQALAEITQALGPGWEATAVPSEAEALAQLQQRSFAALLVDFNLGSPDASELLNQALENRPEMSRFLLAYEADLALVAAKVSGPHEILPKPVEPVSLKSRIESGVTPVDSKGDQSAGEPGIGAGAAPAVPAVYAEVLKLLDSPDVTKRQVAELVAGDAALASELLRLTNSACPGQAQTVADPVEAAESLGLETVKALVMALRFLAEHSQLRPGYLSLEKMWQHSTRVAQLARDLMLFETNDRALAAQALVAGLLHDLGKVVLATNFDDLYGRVHSLARKQPVALWDIEKEMFGASHGEIGGCLVGMWNMPSHVVEAAAFHHDPPLGEHQDLTPLAAVHIANVLEHETEPNGELRVGPIISTPFLNEIGLLQRLPVWRAVFTKRPATGKRKPRSRRRVRAAVANRETPSAAPEVQPAETSQPELIPPVPSSPPPPRTANQLPAPAPPTQTATLGEPASEDAVPVVPPSRTRRWVYACAAAVALGLGGFWLVPGSDEPIRALTPELTPVQVPVDVSPAPALQPGMSEVTPTTVVTAEAPATEDVPLPSLAPWPEPEPTVAAPTRTSEAVPAQTAATNSQAAPTTAPAPAPALISRPQPEIRLNGITYTIPRPSAIVNHRTVYVGDQVSGATVVRIDRTSVTLQINGQRKTYPLR